jgi:hypothetical protein
MSILNTVSLARVAEAQTGDLNYGGYLASVAWSTDGATLTAGGQLGPVRGRAATLG